MSVQATDRDEKHRNARVAGKATARKPSFFKMRAQMLDKGRTNTPLARTDNMWAILKVYASAARTGCHTHPNEDHTFIVLQGSARYYDADGGTRTSASTRASCCPPARTTGSRPPARSRWSWCGSVAGWDPRTLPAG